MNTEILKEIISILIVFLAIGVVCDKLNITSFKYLKFGSTNRAYKNFKNIDIIEGKSLDYISERVGIHPTKVQTFNDYKLCTWYLNSNVITLRFSLDDKCIKVEDDKNDITYN